MNILERVAICENCKHYLLYDGVRACRKIRPLNQPQTWAWEMAVNRNLCPDSKFGPQINPGADFMGMLLGIN